MGIMNSVTRGAALAVLVVGVVVVFVRQREQSLADAAATKAAELAAWQKARESHLRQKCVVEIAAQVAKAASAVKGGAHQDAVNLLLECEDTMTDQKAIALLNTARQAQAAEEAAAARSLQDAQKKQRKREGVAIGMTTQDVLDSSWGRPNRINRTTTARGERQQWVYDGGYLYFDNGVLTTIQN